MNTEETYGSAISAFEFLLENYPSFVIGQGLWSPWYVGNTMQDLDKKFGENRIIDTPVSNLLLQDFPLEHLYQAITRLLFILELILCFMQWMHCKSGCKWSHMTGGQANPALTMSNY